MSTVCRVIRVFLSHPTEMNKYARLAKSVIEKGNATWEKDHRATVRILTFSDLHSRYSQAGVQAAINDAVFGNFEIYSGFMGARFGRPTNNFGSGTEEEYRTAVRRHEEGKSPSRILLGFCTARVDPWALDVDQLRLAQDFKKSIENSQLHYSWDSTVRFNEVFFSQIDGAVRSLANDPSFGVIGGVHY